MKREYLKKFEENHKIELNHLYFNKLYNEFSELINNIRIYLESNKNINIESEELESDDLRINFYIRNISESDDKYLKYQIRSINEDIIIYQYSEIDNELIEIFKINIFIFEYDLESILEFIIRFIQRMIKYINYENYSEEYELDID